MRVTLENTTSSKIAARLVEVREEGGAVALGRVLTLVVVARGREVAESAIAATNEASREHPSRVIVVNTEPAPPSSPGATLDAEIRVGADAGASEVVLLRPHGAAAENLDTLIMPLLLPDAPIVAIWAGCAPSNPRQDPIGAMANRRITDITGLENSTQVLRDLAASYSPGDTDLAWARLTLWRALIASTLEGLTDSVSAVSVKGVLDRPSTPLLGGWLGDALDVPVTLEDSEAGHIERVTFSVDGGEVRIDRPAGSAVATISRPGRKDQVMNLPVRPLSDCLMEDLRRLDADEVYATALHAAVTHCLKED